MHIKIRQLLSVALMLVMVYSCMPNQQISAENAVSDKNSEKTQSEYEKYIVDSGSNNSDVTCEIPLGGGKFSWDGEGETTFTFEVQKTALYNIGIEWIPCKTGVDINLGLKIDGNYPFDGAKKIVLTREWKNVTDTPRVDSDRNEYAPEQEETGESIFTVLWDSTGVITEPYLFCFTAGAHTLTLSNSQQPIEITKLELLAPENCRTYSEVSEGYNLKKSSSDIITVQGEDAAVKSSKTIIPKNNNSDAGMTPAEATYSRINYIGGTAWEIPGATLKWKIKAEKSGYYYIDMRYKQSDLVNGESYRWLKIDGKTPFEEAKKLCFPYGTKWKYYTFGDKEGKPYYIWLDKGEHTISMEVTLAEQSEYFERLAQIVETLGDEYIEIVMITGEAPDINRDYELFKQIPQFTETLTSCKEKLDTLSKDMKAKSGEHSSQLTAAMDNMNRVLQSMIKSPYIAHQYVKDYYTNYTSLNSWLYDMKSMPLSIDEISFIPYGVKTKNKNPGFFKKAAFSTKRLISSFSSDYKITSNAADKEDKSIRLWVNWGQDQAAVLKSIIEDSFTSKTGIQVQLEIVNASLVNGILAGNFPDVSLHMSRTEPVNLGMRGALYDLNNFSDCNEVLQRFQPNAELPYRNNNALYALPDTQSFFLMFYRTDVFDRLGLEVPKTWDKFIYDTTIIQRNNMNVYVPYTQITATTTVNAGIGSLNLFPTFMSQNGLSLYNADKTATALTTQDAIETFTKWTDLYTKHGILKEANFYNRFRVGVMPLGIAPYSTYMTLYSAAPEIQGRWSVALVPGNNEGNCTIAGAGTGCAIIKKSSNKKEAWEFLKWWTSAEVQERYTSNVESILGMIGRTATANVEAFSNLAWDQNDLKTLTAQWQQVREIPEVPGSYYLTRALDQAYWTVINDKSNVKDALDKWSIVADDEITRKLNEYGLEGEKGLNADK